VKSVKITGGFFISILPTFAIKKFEKRSGNQINGQLVHG
jgi:hypothetical protein